MGNNSEWAMVRRQRMTRRVRAMVTALVAMALVGAGIGFEPQVATAAPTAAVTAAPAAASRITATAAFSRPSAEDLSGTEQAGAEPALGGGYQPVTPARIMDTRDGLGLPAALADGASADLQVTGQGGIPAAGVGAVVLNVTATNATRQTFVTVWPAGQALPLASNLNVVVGDAVPNLVIVPVSAAGKVSFFNNDGSVDLIADVQGWFPTGSDYKALNPTRIMDTRLGLGAPTALGEGATVDLQVNGLAGLPAVGVGAVVLNVTATNPTSDSFITAWPAGIKRPLASNLNVVAGQTSPNLVIVPVGTAGAAAGKISLFNNGGTTDLVADVEGWFPVGTQYMALTPARVLDTRIPLGVAGSLHSASTVDLLVTGVGGVPSSGVSAVVLNVTATNPSGSSYVTVWPTGVTQPLASNLNVVAGQTSPNLVIVPIGAGGKVSLYNNNGDIDLIADVQGWFPSDSSSSPPLPKSDFAIRPASVLLAPDQSTVVTLMGLDANGLPIDAPSVSAVSLDSVGGGATAEYLGNNRIRLTAGADIGSTVFAVTPAGAPVPTSVTASVVELQPGVEQIPDFRVVYPVPYLESADAQPIALGDLYSSEGIAGFTFAEMQARTDVATGEGAIDPADLSPTDAYFPLIVRGDAPPVDSLIVTAGGSGVLGRVIEPAGAATLRRGDFSLLTVRAARLKEIYLKLVYDVDSQDLRSIGVTIRPDRSVTPESNQRLRPDNVEGVQSLDDPSTVYSATPKCEASVGVASVQLNNFSPSFDIDISNVLVDVEHDHYRVAPKATGTLTGGITLTLQRNVQADCSFPLSPLAPIESPIPLGPLTGLLSATLESQMVAKIGITLTGGPKLTWAVNCTVGGTVQVGFDMNDGAFQNLSGFTPIFTCPDYAPKFESNINDGQVGVSLGIQGGVFLRAYFGGRIGGAISRGVGYLFKNKNLGVTKMLTADIGPNINFAEENSSNVLANQKSGTKLQLTIKGSMKVELNGFNAIKKVFGDSDGSVELSLFNKEIPLITAFEAPSANKVEYSINGEGFHALDDGGKVYVEPGDHVAVRSTLSSDVGSPHVDAVYTDDNPDTSVLDGFVPDTKFTKASAPAANQFQVEADYAVSDPACVAAAGDDKDTAQKEYRILGTSDAALFGWDLGIEVPIWGGGFTVECVTGRMKFDPNTLLDLGKEGETTLLSHGKSDDEWFVKSKPSFIDSVTAADYTLNGNPGQSSDDQTRVVVKTVDRGNICITPGVGDIVVGSTHRGTATLHVEEAPQCYIKFDPDVVKGTGAKVLHVKTKGIVADTWRIDTPVDWISTVEPIAGDLDETSTEKSFNVGIYIEAREPTCEIQLPETTTLTLRTNTRKEATVRITRPLVPRDPSNPDCPKPLTGGGDGDPHMHSFDGGYFDAQVRGEYIYARSTAGAPDDVEIRTRQEPTRSTAVAWPVTSITATAVRVGDHKIEVYARDLDGHQLIVPVVLIDGATVELTNGRPVEVTPGFSIVVTDSYYLTITAPGVRISLAVGSGIMNTNITAQRGAPLVGLLGTPNGDLTDDFTPLDSPTVHYTVGQIQQQGAESRAFTDSWRVLTSAPNNGASMFSQSYVGINDSNPPWDAAGLEPYIAQATALLASLGSVCDLGASAEQHLLDGLALELAIGRTSKDVAAYACTYVVGGVALSGDSALPGMNIAVDAPGLTPCTTTTGPDGTYQCLLLPDPDEIEALATAGTPPTSPLPVTIVGRFAGQTESIASATNTFPSKALVAGTRIGTTGDLDVDPSLLPNLNVSGTMLQAHAPFPATVPVEITGYNAANAPIVVLQQNVVVDATGGYSFTKVLPLGATHATVTAKIGVTPADHRIVSPTGLVNGPNSVPFSFDYDPSVVTISGSMTGAGGVALAGPIDIGYIAYNGVTPIASGTVAVSPMSGGSYSSAPIIVPLATTRVVATARVGVAPTDWVSVNDTTIAPGAHTTPLNVTYIPPTIALTGVMQQAGAPITTPTHIYVNAYNASNVAIFNQDIVVTPAGDGHFTLSGPVVVPRGSARVTFRVPLGVVANDYPTTTVLDPPNGAVTNADLTFDHDPPVITISGTMRRSSGVALAGPVTVRVRATYGVDLYTTSTFVTPDPTTGAYSATVVVPVNTSSVDVTAQVGAVPADYVTVTDASIDPGSNAITLDVDYGAPVASVSGTFTYGAGAPYTLATYISLKAFNGPTTLGNYQVAVTPAAVTGAYSTAFDLPLATTSVVVTGIAGELGDRYPLSPVAISAGNNPITLNVVHNPPVITVSGTMTAANSTPITTSQLVHVQLFDAADALVSDQYRVANPDGSGHYSFTFMTLHTVVKARFTPEVGFGSDWVTTTKLPTAGVNAFTIDVNLNVARLDVSGTLLRNGSPMPGPVSLTVTAYNSADAVVASLAQTVTPDSTTGAYSVTTNAPMATTRVTVTANISQFPADAFSQQYTGIVQGTNALTFDVTDTAKRLHVVTTITRDGSAYVGALNFVVRHTVPGTADLQQRNYFVSPSPAGTYTLDQLLPDGTTSAEVAVSLQVAGGSSAIKTFTSTYTGLTDPVNNRTWSIDYVPVRFTLSGTILRDGATPAGTVPVTVLFRNAGDFTTGSLTTNVDPDANGAYSVQLPVPDQTTSAEVTVQQGPSYDWYISGRLPVAADVNSSGSYSVDYVPVYVMVGGRIRDVGVAADTVTITARGLDADSNLTGVVSGSVVVTPNGTGDFSAQVGPYPRGSAVVQVSFVYHLLGELGQTHAFSTGVDSTAGGNLTLSVQHDTQRLRITGRLVDGSGNPTYVDGVNANVEEFTDATAGSDRGGTSFRVTSNPMTGLFQIDLSADVSAARVELRIGQGATVNIPLDPDRDTTANVGDYTFTDPQTVRVGGTWSNGYVEDPDNLGTFIDVLPSDVRIVLTPYAFDPANYALQPAYTTTGPPIEVTVTADGDFNDADGGIDVHGDFVGRMTLPVGTTAVSVVYYVDGDPEPYGGEGFQIDPSLTDQLLHLNPFYGEGAGNEATVRITTKVGDNGVTLDCSNSADGGMLVHVTLETYDSTDSDPNHYSSVFNGYVLADPLDGSVVMRIPRRSGYDRIRYTTSTDGIYPSGSEMDGTDTQSDNFDDQPWVIVWRKCP